MRTRAALGGVFASIVVLVIGWQVGSSASTTSTTATPSTSGGTTGKTSGTTSGTTAGTAGTTPDSTSGATTYTGDSVSTRFGDVQVAITVSGGTITDVTAVHLTDHDGRSVDISNRAAPVLRSEVLAAQSSQVSTVSGATYTSDAYLTSLQSAIDQAGL